MPVLNTERRAATRSALRYRPIVTDQALPAPVVSRARRSQPDVCMAAAPATSDDLDTDEKLVPPRRTSAPHLQRPVPPARPRRRVHPLLFVGLGLVLTILLWEGISQAMRWGTNEYNTLVYGYPRTYQVDAVVGQGDNAQRPSHFVAINLHGTITIIDFPAGDPGRARVLATTNVLGPNADLAVVTLAFIDISHNGKPDMLVTIDGVESVLVNDGKTFRLPTPDEEQQILEMLRRNGQ